MTSSLVGRTLGRYRLDAALGRGGMAEVYRATDTRLGREVAVKVILPVYAAEEHFLQRFQREAQVVASLEHPHVLPVYDFGDEDGLPYLVMPYVPFGTLAARLTGAPQPLARAAAWIAQLAGALDVAHAAGVLHRDVKPGNVLVGVEERLFLADFGIAKLCAATRLTRTGMVVGTPVYMAPEVAAGKPAGPEADRYSLAVMAYEMLTGRPPFEGENVLSILHQHATSPVPPATTRVESLPAGLDGLLARALAKDPAARPPSCRAFAEALFRHLPTGERTALDLAAPSDDTAPTLPLRAVPMPRTAAPTTPEGTYATLRPSRRFRGIATVAAAVTVVAAALVVVAVRDRPPDDGLAATTGPEVPAAATAPARVPGPATGPGAGETPAVPGRAQERAGRPLEPEPTAPASAPVTPAVEAAPAPEAPLERRRVPVAAGLAAARELFLEPRFQEVRLLATRPTAGDFDRVGAAAGVLAGRDGGSGPADAVARWTEGGRRYLAGDATGGADALRTLAADPAVRATWGPSAFLVLAASDGDGLDPWEVALGYGDPRRTAAADLDARLAVAPGDPLLRFARALVHRLDGEPRRVLPGATAAFEALHGPDLRAFAAMVAGDAAGALGDEDARLRWYGEAVAVADAHKGPLAVRASRLARQTGREEDAVRFAAAACDAGIQAACGPGAGRRERPLAGRRRRPGGG